MFNASAVITDFLKKTTLGGWRFVDAIVNANNIESRPSVKFIWYDVTEEIESKHISPEEKFSDLNIGKIGLTNAELIKALFLNNVGDDESESLRLLDSIPTKKILLKGFGKMSLISIIYSQVGMTIKSYTILSDI